MAQEKIKKSLERMVRDYRLYAGGQRRFDKAISRKIKRHIEKNIRQHKLTCLKCSGLGRSKAALTSHTDLAAGTISQNAEVKR